MSRLTCAARTGFEDAQPVCGAPATVLVTVSGSLLFDTGTADAGAPHCGRCARIIGRIIHRYYPSATFTSVPIADDAGPRPAE